MVLFRKFGLYVALVTVVLGALMPAASFAQTPPPVRAPLRLMTSPLPLNVVTKPGQTVTADIRVKNNGTQPEQLRVELLKFGASGDTGRPQLQERDPEDVYFNWVSFSESNFTAEPNVWKTIKMTIKAPKEAAFGYYFAVLFSRSNPDRPAAGASGVEGGVASLVLLSVDAPGARREAKVAEIVASQKVYEFLPAKMTIKLRNAGNVHVAPSGTMFIKQGSKQVGALNFNVERGNILPGTNRTFEMSWNDGFPVFEEKTEGSKTTRSLKWNLSNLDKLRFGRYTANLVAVYDDGQRDVPVEAVVSFWVIPWRILGVLLLIILLVGFGTWALLRFVWKNVRRQVAAVPVESEPDPSSLAAATKKPKKNHRNERHEELKTDENNEDASPDAAYRKPVVETERRSSPGQPDSQQPRQQKASTPKKSQKALTANDTNRPSKAKHNKRKRNHKQRRRHE